MKKSFLPIGILFLGIFCSSAMSAGNDSILAGDPAPFRWGEVQSKEGVTFTVEKVEIREWLRGRPAAQAGSPLGLEPIKMIAITYGLKNQAENKKLDLTNGFVFMVSDEFGNQYQELEKPLDYSSPTMVPNKNFPSLYPQESFAASIFFEAPVEASQVLSFTIDAQSIGVAEDISFHLPVVRALPVKIEEPVVPLEEDLQVVIPPDLNSITPGGNIPIKVNWARRISSPDRIYIITPFYLYEDQDSTGNYDLRIPEHQPEGPLTVIILASWRIGDDEQTLSKSFTVTIKKLLPPCRDNCAQPDGFVRSDIESPSGF